MAMGATLRLAAGTPDRLQWQTTKQDTLLVCVTVGESGRSSGISTSPSLRQFHDLRNDTHVANRRAMPMAHVLWWPRRSLATLDRKSRQGRKAATVSIDAGAEVNRRGHHPNFARLQASFPEHRLAHDRSSKKRQSARAAPRGYARPAPARAQVRAGPASACYGCDWGCNQSASPSR